MVDTEDDKRGLKGYPMVFLCKPVSEPWSESACEACQGFAKGALTGVQIAN